MALKKLQLKGKILIASLGLVLTAGVVYAQQSELSQQINAGILTAAILDSNRDEVATPSVDFGATNFAFDCQPSTATLGTVDERLYVTNPSATDVWTLGLAATGGETAVWEDTTDPLKNYAFNNPAGTGCDEGQLTVDPSGSTPETECSSCTLSGVNVGSSASFDSVGGVGDITLMSASSADEVWRGYLIGVELSQEIPGETPAGNYSLDMTLTIAAS